MKSPGFVYVSNRQVYSLDDLIVVMDFSSLWNLVDFHVVSLVHLDGILVVCVFFFFFFGVVFGIAL